MSHNEQLCRCLSHIYIACTVLGMLFLFLFFEWAIPLLAIGANSIYISIGIFTDAEVGRFWGACALAWFFLFPIYLLVAYILALKKHYFPIFVAFLLDITVVLFASVHLFASGNLYGFRLLIVDLFVSMLIALLFFRHIRTPKEK